MISIEFKIIRDVKPPEKAYEFDAGIDFYIPNDMEWENKLLSPQQHILIPSGIIFQLPTGWCLSFQNKSGIAWKKGLIVGAATIDCGYVGEIHIHLINVSKMNTVIKRGMKIAQGLILPVPEIELKQIHEKLKTTQRGSSGFGSTG